MSLFSSILVVDDEKNTREGLAKYLEGMDFDVITASNGREAWNAYLEFKPDLVLADIRMPEMDGIALLEKIKEKHPYAKVILLTAYGSVEDAVKAMKKGAFYYLTKPVNFEELEFQVRKSLANQVLEQENQELRQALFQEKFENGEIVAKSQKMKALLQTVDKVAQSQAAVLIQGESGTGKELIAHRIHQLSPRKNQPFIVVHCAALTETLLPSELFGHEKGAFTGAIERKVGRFERAHQGTLFLDEVGEISKETQVKLLRVLQDGDFERVGGTKIIKTDVRLVCATNKNLIEEVNAGRFREDLYYRINVIYLEVPPLRERREDIAPLVESFTRHFSSANSKKMMRIDEKVLEVLTRYNWPGNVREIKNIIERMIVLSHGSTIEIENVPRDILQGESSIGIEPNAGTVSGSSGRIADMEKQMIDQTLQVVKGNKSLAAKKLGISRRTLYRKLEEYQL